MRKWNKKLDNIVDTKIIFKWRNSKTILLHDKSRGKKMEKVKKKRWLKYRSVGQKELTEKVKK